MKQSPMSDEFHDWLDQCPVTWIREKAGDKQATYYFWEEDEDAGSE